MAGNDMPSAVPMNAAQAGQRVKWAEYTLYFAGYVQTLTQITAANPVGELSAGQEMVQVKPKGKDGSEWLLSTYPTLQSRVPFIQYGYKRDAIDRETFVSVMEPARTDFENLVNRASEYALMLALHVFLQKYQYVGECKFTAPGLGKCNHGRMSASPNEVCPKCQGTGNAILATVQDVVTIKLPDEGETIAPLQNMIYYPTLPFEIVDHLKLELDEKPDLIERAMWGYCLVKNGRGYNCNRGSQEIRQRLYHPFASRPTLGRDVRTRRLLGGGVRGGSERFDC